MIKKLKILIPCIALLVVLSFSITIGVFAATTSTVSLNSSVSFVSPDLDVVVNCYIGNVVKQTPDHVFTKDSVEPWNINPQNFSFVAVKDTDEVEDVYLTFVVTNNTQMPIYSYFTLNGQEQIITTDSLDGNATQSIDGVEQKINEDIVDVSLTGQQKIDAKEGNVAQSSTFKIKFKLNKNIKTEDSATFNYSLVVAKQSANLFNVGTVDNYVSSESTPFTVENGTITGTSNGYAGTFVYNSNKIAPGKYRIICNSTGTNGNRILAKAFNEEDNVLEGSIIIDGGYYLSTYLGYYFDTNENYITITVPDSASYWNLGFVFHGEAGESVSLSNIQLLQI